MARSELHDNETAPRFTRHPWILSVLCVLGMSMVGWSLFSHADAQTQGFADPAFEALWNRSDGVVASGGILRPWVWGPVPGAALTESFSGLPNDSHIVQFFDKGRMEINDPGADKSDPFYVTNGRLAVELVSGQIQTGLDTFEDRSPAQIDLASDVDDPTAPTYLSFNGVVNLPGTGQSRFASDHTGAIVRTAIDRQGNTQPWPADHPDYGVTFAYYEKETSHNIPDVFWTYLNQQTSIVQDGQVVQGPLFYPWFAVTGYPVSEPYWSYVKVEGKYTDVLIQVYERRVLTFIPHLPSPYKVQMGNIGQHYYDWRYGKTGGGPPGPVAPTPTAIGLPPEANVIIDGISYRASVIDINGTYCTITNRDNQPVSLDGWRLDSPKWAIVDTFRFPSDVVLQPGASINVHSGPGLDTPTDIYMARTTVMWDGQPYDYAVLYDNYGRQVSDFFPAGDVGPPPTQPPAGPTPTESASDATATPTFPPGKETSTPIVPPPAATNPPGAATDTPSPTVTGTVTETPTPTPGSGDHD
ncbi:MAG TPA: lamin tail domain-containing protein [Chloroflexia bacterium]|nr:lamin tail domain-containing protein [Chloroflexia bacterium]